MSVIRTGAGTGDDTDSVTTGDGGFNVDIDGRVFHVEREQFRTWKRLDKAGGPGFALAMSVPGNRAAYEAILKFKAHKADDEDEIGSAGRLGGGRLSVGGRVVAGGNIIPNKGIIKGPSVDTSPSSYTHGSTTSTSMILKLHEAAVLRDLAFTSTASDTQLFEVKIGTRVVFTAGKSATAGVGILLTELGADNNRAGFLAGHRVDKDVDITLTFIVPTSGTVRVSAEHDTAALSACS